MLSGNYQAERDEDDVANAQHDPPASFDPKHELGTSHTGCPGASFGQRASPTFV